MTTADFIALGALLVAVAGYIAIRSQAREDRRKRDMDDGARAQELKTTLQKVTDLERRVDALEDCTSSGDKASALMAKDIEYIKASLDEIKGTLAALLKGGER